MTQTEQGMTEDTLALEQRDALPDALRVLLQDYPRADWPRDPGFDGLVRFWLDRHLMFRRLLKQLTEDTEARLDGRLAQDRYGAGLARYGGMLVNELHGHHTIEDMHYFPLLAQHEPALNRGFAILDRDHHALDGHLAGFVTAANAVLQAAPADGIDPAGAFHTSLAGLSGLLDRHLTDEEELVVPVLLKHGTGGLS